MLGSPTALFNKGGIHMDSNSLSHTDYLNNSLAHPINKEDFLSGKACIVYRNGLDLSDAGIIGKNVTCALYEDQQMTKTFTIEGVTDENYYTALLGYPPTIIASDQV